STDAMGFDPAIDLAALAAEVAREGADAATELLEGGDELVARGQRWARRRDRRIEDRGRRDGGRAGGRERGRRGRELAACGGCSGVEPVGEIAGVDLAIRAAGGELADQALEGPQVERPALEEEELDGVDRERRQGARRGARALPGGVEVDEPVVEVDAAGAKGRHVELPEREPRVEVL